MIVSIAISAFALEWSLGVAARGGWIRVELNPLSVFWVDRNPDFGVWHVPNGRFDHITPCFTAQYLSNSYGAVDVERPVKSREKRVVVLGDSMMEGYTLQRPERLSDVLETSMGIGFMNFATSQTFGPVQYLLDYETLAGTFDHDAVLVGVLPENDFTDNNWEFGRQVFYNRYRPYFVRSGDTYNLTYFSRAFLGPFAAPDDALGKLSNAFFNATNTGRTLRTLNAQLRYKTAITSMAEAFSGVQSWYYDYSEEDWKLLEFTIRRLVGSAHGKPVIVATIPMEKDLLAHRTRGTAPLSERFATFARAAGFVHVDLMDPFAAAYDAGTQLYHTCDHHWTAEGNRIAADLLRPKIAAAMASRR